MAAASDPLRYLHKYFPNDRMCLAALKKKSSHRVGVLLGSWNTKHKNAKMPLKRAGRLSENKGNSSSDLQQCTRIDVYRSSVVLVVVEVLKMFYESQQIVTRPRHGRIQAPPSAPDFEIPDPRFRKLSHQQPPRKVSRLYQWRLTNYKWANLRYSCLS